MMLPLYPLSLLYQGITWSRNQLYERGLLPSVGSDRMLICVGNLSVGGTGKTPMVEELVRLLQPRYPLATLSRGYGRQSKGYRLAGPGDSARTLGDEPYQYYQKWKGTVPVAVGEDRAAAIDRLLADKPETALILLDDAYQHRRVRADLNVLLTSYDLPFWKDWLLPAGRLRESRQGAKRAHVLVITKCPAQLSPQEQEQLRRQAAPYLTKGVPIYFSTIAYEPAVALTPAAAQATLTPQAPVMLLSGLAKPAPFEAWVRKHFRLLEHHQYADHHPYTPKELERLQQAYARHASERPLLLTSEKMRPACRIRPYCRCWSSCRCTTFPSASVFLLLMMQPRAALLRLFRSWC
ncbi:tetraacyldisaccharide 4'-kinase [Cesiribacter andamanensis]|uniref:Tetraacyldisaccharide 4'-kinase n=1 Tax=Cesiribacter andamanensis AMV16 TaxID=1279009 RepID=M7NMC8_9BACT|nr:tetraacyldisaccharide 4'-kinase [Cesiribacter andamanensis]EMR02940.1 Tetraacyldisaccharide 4'-kinase [Cesiribacter andamanensis AMV16]